MSKKKLVIGMLICFVLLIPLVYMVNEQNKKPSDVVIDGSELEGVLAFSGMSVFVENYTGEFKSKEITAKLQELVKKDILELYKDIRKLDEDEIKKYYSDNKDSVKKKFGIQTEEEFINFSNKISQTKIKLDTWQKVKINRETFLIQSDKTNYAYVEFDIIFESEERLSFSMYVANIKTMSPQYIFAAK